MKFWLSCVVNSIILSILFKEKSDLVVLVAPEFGCCCEYISCPLKYRPACPVAWSHLLELHVSGPWPGTALRFLCCVVQMFFSPGFEALIEKSTDGIVRKMVNLLILFMGDGKESDSADGRILWSLPSRKKKWTQHQWALGSLLDGVHASRSEKLCWVTCAFVSMVRLAGSPCRVVEYWWELEGVLWLFFTQFS